MTLKKYLDPPALRKNVMRLEKTVKGSTEISGEKFGKYPYRISLNNVELIQQNKKKELIAIFGAHILSSIAKYVQQCPAKKANTGIATTMDTAQKLAEVKKLNN